MIVWIPSNFKGFISYAGAKASFSPGFMDFVLPNAYINRQIPKSWSGDRVIVQTSGSVAFRVWDVFAKTPEKTDVWRKVFRGSERRASNPMGQAWNWDFLIEDEDDY